MRKIASLAIVFMLISTVGFSQKEVVGKYEFTVKKDVEALPVQDQYRTGTCWSFSTLSFIESEIKRIKGTEVKLAEMWIVRHTYIEKADRFIRMHGKTNFEAGGGFHDVTRIIEKYGIVPQTEYTGLNYGTDKHNHSELNEVLKAMCNAIVKNPNKTLTTAWKPAIEAVLDAYLGKVPSTFTYNGKKYTPKSFAEFLKFNADDYVEITSFTHHPFYSQFVMEIPDNWMWGSMYNMPLEDFKTTLNHALDNGFSLAWAADVSEYGFSHKNGVAIVPVGNWDGVSRSKVDSIVKIPQAQEKITQDMRQEGFDNYQTQDDHGMHLVGYVTEKNGDTYYIIKNSWGEKSNSCGGYLYASESYVLLKTIDFMVHKDAIPKNIKKKLNIN